MTVSKFFALGQQAKIAGLQAIPVDDLGQLIIDGYDSKTWMEGFNSQVSMEQFKDILVRRVTEMQGCKATELVMDREVITAVGEINLLDALGQIVAENRVIEIEYVLPDLEYRVKSFYLPANTQVRYRR